MFVEQYLERFSSNPLMPEPAALDIGGALARTMMTIRDSAEAQGIELGCNIYFLAGSFDIGMPRTGDQTAVNLDTQHQSRNDSFVGDFHVHPYARKMSPTASVGFSTGDTDSYLTTNSKHMLRFHFVAAGPKLWLIVTYPWNSAAGARAAANNVGCEGWHGVHRSE